VLSTPYPTPNVLQNYSLLSHVGIELGNLTSFIGFSNHNAATLKHQSCWGFTSGTAAQAIAPNQESSLLATKVSFFCHQAIDILPPFFIATTGGLSRPA